MPYISLFLLFLSLNVNAAIAVDGQFKATQSCQAYASKNTLINPDQQHLEPTQSYRLRKINHQAPDWLGIELVGQHPTLRWVRASCGEFNFINSQNTGCDISPGLADSYVLALSWQPAFCETYGYEAGKPECLTLTSKSYASRHPTLHGLWPNQKACGTNYGFCGVSPKRNHCAYSPLKLSLEVSNRLKVLMPSYAHGSCLERHEWNKHGSCQVLSSDAYFSLAMRLSKEVDGSVFAAFLRDHQGERIQQKDLRQTLRQAFGEDADEKVFLGCKNGMLVDIYFHLPALIPEQDPLRDLMARAERLKRYNGCPKQLKISNFTNAFA